MTQDTRRPRYDPEAVLDVHDILWPRVHPLVLEVRPPDPRRHARRRVADDSAFLVVLDVLLNRTLWRGGPDVSRATAHRRFTEWSAAGLWARLREDCPPALTVGFIPVGAVAHVVCRLAELRAAGRPDTGRDLDAEARAMRQLRFVRRSTPAERVAALMGEFPAATATEPHAPPRSRATRLLPRPLPQVR